MHVPPQTRAEIRCECDMTVTFAVRKGTSATLDGQKVITAHVPDFLPRGMRVLYEATEELVLTKGTHTVTTSEDMKYLPSVLLSGDFLCKSVSGDVCTLNISKRDKKYTCGEKIQSYGTVEFVADTTVPEGATAIEIDGTALVTRAYANDALLGTRAFAPSVFPVDNTLWNQTIRLTIVQFSSLAPMFGNVDFWDKTIPDCGWRGTPSTTHPPFGFSGIRWLF